MLNPLKKILVFLLFVASFTVHSQQIIKGFVLTQNREAAKNVSVFFNYTTKHILTNENGYFELSTSEGYQELIISSPGYKSIKHKLEVTKYNSALTFILVKNDSYFKPQLQDKEVFNHFFTQFKEVFLGTTALSKNCVIKNPEVLRFSFDVFNGLLSAKSVSPLEIENKSLGYKTFYDLVSFNFSPEKTSYDGYAYYKEMKASPEVETQWKKNRKIAYEGSRVHFIRSLINRDLEKQGFFIHQFRRIENYSRPSEAEVSKARKVIAENYTKVDFSKKITNPQNKVDSAIVVLRKEALPKFEDITYNKRLSYDEMMVENNNNYFIKFKDHLKVIYTKRPEEREFLDFNYQSRFKKPGYQITNINLLTNSILLDKSGMINEPLDFLMEGYWAFKRIADALPLDYYPEKITN